MRPCPLRCTRSRALAEKAMAMRPQPSHGRKSSPLDLLHYRSCWLPWADEREGAAHVRVEEPLPHVGGQRVEVLEGDADVPARVVDEDVEPAERARGRGH